MSQEGVAENSVWLLVQSKLIVRGWTSWDPFEKYTLKTADLPTVTSGHLLHPHRILL